jgi:23S rRNA pseudouridine955/2504/2580 synthase
LIQIEVGQNDGGQRIDRLMRKKYPQLGLNIIFSLFRKKKIRLNGVRAKVSDLVQSGDTICIYEDIAPALQLTSTAPDPGYFEKYFRVVYEDEDRIVMNKFAGVPAQPGSGQPPGTSQVEMLWHYLKVWNSSGFKPSLAHRLDKGTSGLILGAKSAAFLRYANEEIRMRRIKKEYLCLIKGCPKELKGTISDKLERSGGVAGPKMVVSTTVDAVEALTHYEVIKQFKGASLVRVDLETGRMHQIRSHFALHQHPLAGDDRYGDFEWNRELKKEIGLKRMFLHACSLKFETFSFEESLPEELETVLLKLGS